MNTISLREWMRFKNKLAAISTKASDEFVDHFVKGGGYGKFSAQEITEYAYALATKYGEASAELACQMYDATAAAGGVNVSAAEPAATATYQETAKAIYGTLGTGNMERAVGRLVKQAGADTTLKNALRDKAQFAWIPSGDTCSFCLTLASRGWQYMSKDALKNGHATHIHANCDCTYAVRFDRKSTVEGYNPDKYLEMYQNAEGDTPQEKINSMRRMQYASRKQMDHVSGLPIDGNNGIIKKIEAYNPFKNPKTPLKIDKYLQSKHHVGGERYLKYMESHEYEPSLLTIDSKQEQDLVDKYHGTGIWKLNKNGEIIPKELIIDHKSMIGIAIDNRNGNSADTQFFSIHYGKNGTHITPAYPSQGEYYLKERENNGSNWLYRQKS